jgi:hypothetical protein
MGKIEIKIRYFIKRKNGNFNTSSKTELQHFIKTALLTQNPEKTSKQKSRKNEREKEQNSTPQISTGNDVSTPGTA